MGDREYEDGKDVPITDHRSPITDHRERSEPSPHHHEQVE
jgi:hypothetical protein